MGQSRKRKSSIKDNTQSFLQDARKTPNLNVEVVTFARALKKLESILSELPGDAHQSSLFFAGFAVALEVRQMASDANNKISEEKLIEILRSTTNLVAGNMSHPEGDQGYRKEIDSYYQLANDVKKFSMGKVLAATLLALIGTAIIVASGIVAAVSFGLLTPITLLGVTLGLSTIVGGIAVGTGVLGMGMEMSSGILLFNAAKKNPLRTAMENLETSAREHYNFPRRNFF